MAIWHKARGPPQGTPIWPSPSRAQPDWGCARAGPVRHDRKKIVEGRKLDLVNHIRQMLKDKRNTNRLLLQLYGHSPQSLDRKNRLFFLKKHDRLSCLRPNRHDPSLTWSPDRLSALAAANCHDLVTFSFLPRSRALSLPLSLSRSTTTTPQAQLHK